MPAVKDKWFLAGPPTVAGLEEAQSGADRPLHLVAGITNCKPCPIVGGHALRHICALPRRTLLLEVEGTILIRRLKITSASTERQKRSQNLAPVLVIIWGRSGIF